MPAETTTKPIKINLRNEAKARTRTKVLNAARNLFETVGYKQATIRAVARDAKMSTGAVFASFDDKLDLYEAVYGHAPITPEQGAELAAALRLATSFVSGFECDNSQQGIEQLLHRMNTALAGIARRPRAAPEHQVKEAA